jgi:hypothetical protein
VDHVAFWVPVLIGTIAKDFNELLENSSLAAIATLRELRRVVVVAVHLAIMFVVTVLSAKDSRAN